MNKASIRPTTKEAYELFHEGNKVMAEAEFNGIRMDRKYLQIQIDNQKRLAKRMASKIRETELGKVWEKRYGSRMDFGNDHQLRQVLFVDMGIVPSKYTTGGKNRTFKLPSVDVGSLEQLKREDVNLVIRKKQVEKNVHTYLENLLLESEADGYCHPFFHLSSYHDDSSGGARTFRGSSSNPNFQNQPNRREEDRKLIRSAFLPRPGNRLVGRDYSGIEVRISCCNHHDKNMIRYVESNEDMHKDCAAEVFMLPPDLCTKKGGGRWGKEIRQTGKNGYVFPQFYLQQPVNTAKGLWKQMVEMPLRHPSDPNKTIEQHLREKRIRNYEAFEKHVLKVIDGFWTSMFPGFKTWRDKWIAEYHKKGYFDMLTGFRVEGVMEESELGNYPIQGPAFHCLLWSSIQTYHLWKNRTKSLIIGQIHDEMTSDEPEGEFQNNQKKIPSIMTEQIRKEWDWIIVPLEVETEATPVNGNWYEKRKVD